MCGLGLVKCVCECGCLVLSTCIYCVACPYRLQSDLQQFYLGPSSGISHGKLIIGLPLYGYCWHCTHRDDWTVRPMDTPTRPTTPPPVCTLETTGSITSSSSSSVPVQVGLGTLTAKLPIVTAKGRDSRSDSPWLEYVEEKHTPKGLKQCWCNTYDSLAQSGLIEQCILLTILTSISFHEYISISAHLHECRQNTLIPIAAGIGMRMRSR